MAGAMTASAVAQGQAPAAGVARPNIVFIYADDWGWGDLACHGHPHLKTPNLDRLAREGTDFQQFTVCNPVCSPSRTAIVTGHYPARHQVHQHFADHAQNVARGMPDWLDPKVVLLPRLLKEAGYATGHFGKWHLSGGDRTVSPPLPAEYGYDDAAVWTGPGRGVFEGTSVADQAGTAQDKTGASFQSVAATEHTLRFIRAAAGRPFYINLWLHETHHLVSATEQDKAAYPDTPEPRRTYYAAVTRADTQVGRVLALLDELKLAQNTIVIFSSDNGPENSHERPDQKFYHSVGETGGLRGRKRSLYMGGVNVPFLVRWPGQVPAGRVDKTSVLAGVDVLPTLMAAAELPLPVGYTPDGENALAAFRGQEFQRKRPVFWEWRGPNAQPADWPQLAMRDGSSTLLMTKDGARVELYDLAADRAQEVNLAPREPERAARMVQALRDWRASLPPPLKAEPEPRPAKGKATAKPKTPTPPATAPGAPPPAKKAAGQDRAAIFKRWDANHDGSLTLQEYTAGLAQKAEAPRRFKAFDKDGNSLLSEPEFVTPGR